jgi:hypothetical protein
VLDQLETERGVLAGCVHARLRFRLEHEDVADSSRRQVVSGGRAREARSNDDNVRTVCHNCPVTTDSTFRPSRSS